MTVSSSLKTKLHKYYRKAAWKLIFHFLAPHQLQLEAAASPCSQCRSPKASHLADFGRCGLWCRLCWCRGRLRRRLRRMWRLWLRLGLQPVGGDLVNLPWGCHVHHVVGLHLNLVARWQEGVETHDQVWVALEELRYTADDPWSVDAGEGIRWQCHILWDLSVGPASPHSNLPSDFFPLSPPAYETMSYKHTAELKSDIILLAQTAFYIHEIQSQVWPLSMGRQPDSQMNQLSRLNLWTPTLSRDSV